MKKKIVGIFVCTLLIATVLPVAEAADKIKTENYRLIAASIVLPEESIVVTLNTEEYEITSFDSSYSELSMQNFGSILNPGEPMLPSKTFFIGLPPGGEVISIDLIEDEIEDIYGHYNIRPAPPIICIDPKTQVEWKINTTIYKSSDPYPSKVYDYLGMSYLRKYSLAMISYSPFTYYPSEDKLALHKYITLRISYKIVDEVSDELLADTVMDDVASDLIVNYPSIYSFYHTNSIPAKSSTFDYVIITTSDLYDFLWYFKSFKESQGFSVKVVNISWITSNYPASDTPKSIRDFLRDNYVSWGIKYLLIAGDISSIPMRICYPKSDDHSNDDEHAIPTDHYYADLSKEDNKSWDFDRDGFYGERIHDKPDFIPEIYVGRIPTDNIPLTMNILYKITEFEQVPNTDWKRNALLLGAIFWYDNEDKSIFPGADGADLMEQCRKNLLTGFSCETMYEKEGLAPSSYPCDYPLTNANVIDQWSSSKGWGIVNMAGHGWYDSVARKIWYDDKNSNGYPDESEMYWPDFILSIDAPSFNDEKPPIVFADSCLTAKPEEANNLGLELLINGASAYIGATRVSHGMWGWKKPWHGGASSLDYFFIERVATLGQSCGQALFNAKVKYEAYFNLIWYWMANLYTFNLYGDPSMKGLNCPPDKPSKPNGPIPGKTFQLYKYNSTAIDPDNDNIYYLFNWGDFTNSGWIGPYNSGEKAEASHRWLIQGSYNIKVKVKDIYGLESDWSEPLEVTMPKNKVIDRPFLNFLQNFIRSHPNMFQTLEKIIQRLRLQ